jgi:hypothetical protein
MRVVLRFFAVMVGAAGPLLRIAVASALFLSATVAVALLNGQPAAAATTAPRPVVYLSVSGVSSAWPVAQAAAYVNRYTRSRLVFGPCRDWAPCVTMSEAGDLGIARATAVTYPTYGSAAQGARAFRTTIQLTPGGGRLSGPARLRTVVHELGHASGLWDHNPRCVSVMYYTSACPVLRFSPAERAILRRN